MQGVTPMSAPASAGAKARHDRSATVGTGCTESLLVWFEVRTTAGTTEDGVHTNQWGADGLNPPIPATYRTMVTGIGVRSTMAFATLPSARSCDRESPRWPTKMPSISSS